MIRHVMLSKLALKQLDKLPQAITIKLMLWMDEVQKRGLEEVRKCLGYHDEPLNGSRKDQRSIRLNRAYRAIYEIIDEDVIEFVYIQEVTKHDY